MANDEGSLTGKGSEIMKPGGFGASGASGAAGETPDLTPEEVARLFPDQPAPAVLAAETEGGLPDWAVEAGSPAESAANVMAAAAAVAPVAAAAAAPAPLPIAPEAAVAASAPPPVINPARETGNRMDDPDIAFYGLEIKEELIGPQAEKYEAAQALEASDKLVDLFVTEALLQKTWEEITVIESEITASRRISGAPGNELLDRLRNARNLLMNARDKFEEAQQEIARVKFRFTRIRKIEFFEEPPFIFIWLIVAATLVVVATILLYQGGHLAKFFNVPDADGVLTAVATGDPAVFLISLLAGATGGVTGALFGLWTHVASKKDYDPEFAIWYYTNPIMGVILGGFAFLFANVGVVEFTSQYAVYLIAFALGFQQNLVIGVLNGVIKKLLPSDAKNGAE